MSGRYLTDLADWLRGVGLVVVEQDGWKTRARSSGGFAAGRPWCVMWHHTASQTTPANDANYMSNGSPDRPIANLLVCRDGSVWVLATVRSDFYDQCQTLPRLMEMKGAHGQFDLLLSCGQNLLFKFGREIAAASHRNGCLAQHVIQGLIKCPTAETPKTANGVSIWIRPRADIPHHSVTADSACDVLRAVIPARIAKA